MLILTLARIPSVKIHLNGPSAKAASWSVRLFFSRLPRLRSSLLNWMCQFLPATLMKIFSWWINLCCFNYDNFMRKLSRLSLRRAEIQFVFVLLSTSLNKFRNSLIVEELHAQELSNNYLFIFVSRRKKSFSRGKSWGKIAFVETRKKY